MSNTASEIARLQTARNKIRTKLVDLGLATSTTKLDALATEIENIENRGAIDAQVQEGESYAIPRGYHNGSGTVRAVGGGGNYELQTKQITPTKAQQSVTPDDGYYGLSAVTVAAIPANYHDTNPVTATADDVLANKVIVTADGETVAGTMTNHGAAVKTLDTTTTQYKIPAGYHNGSGSVSVVTETKGATPTKEKQTITPTKGKVLSSVTVNPIPDEYITTSDADATAENILEGKTAYVDGVLLTGTMVNNDDVSGSIDGLTTTSYTVPSGYTSGGVVSLTDDIERQLAAI